MDVRQRLTAAALFRRGRFDHAVASASPRVLRGWGEAETGDDWFLADTEFPVHNVPVTRVRDGEVIHRVEQHVDIPDKFTHMGGRLYDVVFIHVGQEADPVVEVIIPAKEPGKGRRVFQFSYLDRVCQRSILQVLDAQIDPLLPAHVHAYRRGHDRWSAAHDLRSLIRSEHVFAIGTDIVSFYDSISVDAAMAALTLFVPQLTSEFLALVENTMQPRVLRRPSHPRRRDGTLPPESAPYDHLLQGAILSPIFSNAVGALAIDEPFAAKMGNAATLLRYADNIVVVARTAADCARAFDVLQELVAAQGWHLHDDPAKTTGVLNVLHTPLTWLGVEFSGKRIRVPDARFTDHVARLAAVDPTSPDFALLAHGILGEYYRVDRPRRPDDLVRAVRRQAPAQAAALRQVMAARRARSSGHRAAPWTPTSTTAPCDRSEAAWN